MATCRLATSPDADLAENIETAKSTSGLWIELVNEDGLRAWPLAWRSRRQGFTATSTCEAKCISMATALKSEALPLLDLFCTALGREVELDCLEDNTQCIAAVRNGYSASLRHPPHTERISLSFAHDVFSGPACHMKYQESSLHKGGIFTKRLERAKFEPAASRLGLRKMSAGPRT
jgi:hypothetical protein